MTFVYGVIVGAVAYWSFWRFAIRYMRKQFRPDKASNVRKDILDKMGYDSLLVFQQAVTDELARRTAPATTTPSAEAE